MVCVTADGSTTIAAAASAAGAVAAATTASSIVVAEGHEAIDRRSHRRAVPDAVSRVCPGGRRDTRPVRVDPLLRSPGEPSGPGVSELGAAGAARRRAGYFKNIDIYNSPAFFIWLHMHAMFTIAATNRIFFPVEFHGSTPWT